MPFRIGQSYCEPSTVVYAIVSRQVKPVAHEQPDDAQKRPILIAGMNQSAPNQPEAVAPFVSIALYQQSGWDGEEIPQEICALNQG